jgi:hypothetical protein
MKKVRIGEVVLVHNQNKKVGANNEYYAVILKMPNGPCKFLFTLNEIDNANDRAINNWEDTPERSYLSTFLD